MIAKRPLTHRVSGKGERAIFLVPEGERVISYDCVKVAVLPAFEHAENSELAALVTGNPEKDRELSERYAVKAYTYDDFEKAIDNEDVDAVFERRDAAPPQLCGVDRNGSRHNASGLTPALLLFIQSLLVHAGELSHLRRRTG